MSKTRDDTNLVDEGFLGQRISNAAVVEKLDCDRNVRVEVARATLAAAASASDAEVDSSEALANDVRWALDTFVGTPS